MANDFEDESFPSFDPDPEDDGDEDDYCYRCDNTGVILVCIDDLCRGTGACMHGDGEIICPDCKGKNAW